MRRRAKVLQKKDARKRLPLPFRSQMGGHTMPRTCFRSASSPAAHPAFTPSPFFFLTDSYTLCPLRKWLTIRGCIRNSVLFPKGKKPSGSSVEERNTGPGSERSVCQLSQDCTKTGSTTVCSQTKLLQMRWF